MRTEWADIAERRQRVVDLDFDMDELVVDDPLPPPPRPPPPPQPPPQPQLPPERDRSGSPPPSAAVGAAAAGLPEPEPEPDGGSSGGYRPATPTPERPAQDRSAFEPASLKHPCQSGFPPLVLREVCWHIDDRAGAVERDPFTPPPPSGKSRRQLSETALAQQTGLRPLPLLPSRDSQRPAFPP